MIPASIRNRNPGSQEPGFASRRWGSTTHETLVWVDKKGKKHTNLCATFPTHHHGGAAVFTLLAEGKHYRNKPIAEAIATWCGGHSASQYIDHMEKSTGVKRSAILTEERIRDPDIAVPIAMAIARFEAGADATLPLSEADWRQIHDMAFGEAVAPAPSIDNDVPFQKPEGIHRETIAQRVKRAYQTFWAAVGTISSVGVVGALQGEESYLPAVPQGLVTSVKNVGGWTDLVSASTWQMLLIGSAAFVAVYLFQKVRQ